MDHGSSSSSSHNIKPWKIPKQFLKLNDWLFELYKPPGPAPASLRILFFHGFQRGDNQDAHLSTWQSGDGSCLWPQTWLVEDFPDAHIISVFYPGLKKNQEYGDMDMSTIGENLMTNVLLENIGQDASCSIVLVGHSFGGLAIKQLCLEAKKRASGSERHNNFLANLKGIFFYATPHRGVALEELAAKFVTEEALLEFVKTLSTSTARLNADFDHLVGENWGAWLIGGIGESCPIKWGEGGESVVVPEASSRYGGDFRILPGTDHFSISRPQERTSASFKDLTKFLHWIPTSRRKPGNLQRVHNEIVGHVDILKEVKGKLQKATRLGLEGMGGVGKSTLARALFNDLIQGPTYEYTCFIKDVKKEDLSEDGVQKKVLEDMHHHGKKIEEKNLTFLSRKRLLLVLDDVASERDLAVVSFLQDNIEVHEDSRFIATSRDSKLLKICRYEVYRVPFLKEESSKELFLTYAFRKDAPGPASLAGYVDDIVRKCGGLPLTLEVIGKYLYDEPEDIWEQALSALVAADSLCGFEEKLWAKLKLSYDGLQKHEKDMFLDSATLFYGEYLEKTKENFWSLGIKGYHIAWRHLLDLSLVWEVRSSYGGVFIGMHEQLLSLGRKIASSPQENGRRVWKDDKALEILTTENYNEDDVKDIVALRLYHSWLPKTAMRIICKMEKLRYLELNFVHPTEIDRSDGFALPSGLVYLSLKSVKLSDVSFNPRNKKPTTVPARSDRDSVLTMLAPLGNLAALEHVKIDDCDNALGLHSGAFGCLPRLKRLIIWYCSYLYELPWTLDNFVERLEVRGCWDLSALPDALVSRLKKIRIQNCPRLLKLPEALGKSVESLEILGFHDLSALPDALVSRLKKLKIKHCKRLLKLPEALGNSQVLEHLSVDDCKGLSMLPDIKPGCLQKLRILKIERCSLRHLPGTFLELQGLENLRLKDVSCRTIPDFKKLRSLKTLELSIDRKATLPTLPQCLGEAITESNYKNPQGITRTKAHVFNIVEGKFLYKKNPS